MLNYLILALLVLATSCGKKKSSAPVLMNAEDTYHSRALSITQKEKINFIRNKQMVSKYDCTKTLISRKLEREEKLTTRIIINYENRKNVWSYSVYNRTTKDGKGTFFTSDGKIYISFRPTVFYMQIKEGINEIEYVFNSCTQVGKDSNGQDVCLGIESVEKEGILQLEVVYSKETLPEKHVYPDAAECLK